MKAILILATICFCSSACAASAHGNHVTISCSESWVTGIYFYKNNFYIGTSGDYVNRAKETIRVSISADRDWRIDPEATNRNVAKDNPGGYHISNIGKLERPTGGSIYLCAINVQIDGVVESAETQPGSFVGCCNFSKAKDIVSSGCMVPVRFLILMPLAIMNTSVEISCSGGVLCERTGDSIVAAKKSYSIRDLQSKTFVLVSRSFSDSIADHALVVSHPVTKSSDTARFTCFGGDFTVCSENPEFPDGELTDYRVARMTITPHPRSMEDELTFCFEDVVPDESDSSMLINQFGQFVFPCEEHPDRKHYWRTKDKLLWYAHPEPNCCFHYNGTMAFSLVTRHGESKSVTRKSYPIALSKEESFARGTYTFKYDIGEPELMPGGMRARVKVTLNGVLFSGKVVVFKETQFHEQTQQEEDIHAMQLDPSPDNPNCLVSDLFLPEGVLYYLWRDHKQNFDGEYYYGLAQSADDLRQIAEQQLLLAIEKEKMMSQQHFKSCRRGVLEFEAKKIVDFKAGYKYHCTYLNEYGKDPKSKDCRRTIPPIGK